MVTDLCPAPAVPQLVLNEPEPVGGLRRPAPTSTVTVGTSTPGRAADPATGTGRGRGSGLSVISPAP